MSNVSFLASPYHNSTPIKFSQLLNHKSSYKQPNKITKSFCSSIKHTKKKMGSINNINNPQNFQDHLPLLTEKLGGDGLIGELCKGFELLKDSEKGLITFDSLKKNAGFLGLEDLTDEDLRGMLKEGDYDCDGALSEMEFCVLMFRLSPELMENAQELLLQELQF